MVREKKKILNFILRARAREQHQGQIRAKFNQ